ncbi:MAG TPA: hypothetical protein VE291_01585 [Terracidiphilus sp.]|nr:hypothetical protein [Terracidiphilus sp.]
MLEKEMEDLIAKNPEHFFPNRGFVLQGCRNLSGASADSICCLATGMA